MGKQARMRKERMAARKFLIGREQKIIETFADVAPPILFKYFDANSCLNSVRILIDVMSAWDIPVQPLACGVMVYNRIFWDKLVAKNGPAEDNAEVERWCNEGGWALGIADRNSLTVPPEFDGRDQDNDWDWHLIGVTPTTVIDPTSRQMRRPEKNIWLPDCLLTNMTPSFAAGQPMALEMPNGGAMVSYHPQPQVQQFRKISGFQRSEHNLDLARIICHAVDRALPSELKLRR